MSEPLPVPVVVNRRHEPYADCRAPVGIAALALTPAATQPQPCQVCAAKDEALRKAEFSAETDRCPICTGLNPTHDPACEIPAALALTPARRVAEAQRAVVQAARQVSHEEYCLHRVDPKRPCECAISDLQSALAQLNAALNIKHRGLVELSPVGQPGVYARGLDGRPATAGGPG